MTWGQSMLTPYWHLQAECGILLRGDSRETRIGCAGRGLCAEQDARLYGRQDARRHSSVSSPVGTGQTEA
jgi:hypothetical protein